MSENEKKPITIRPKKNVKNRIMAIDWDRTKITLLFCTIVLLIPTIFFVYILLSAFTNTGKPIIGNRFKDDLNPAIQSAEIKTVQSNIANMTYVESIKIELKVATVRMYVVVNSLVAKEDYEKFALSIYEEVVKIWPEDQYFTVINNLQKQYDIEIHVLNTLTDIESEDFIYYLLVKNSAMDAAKGQLVSEPINPELASNLRNKADEKNNPVKVEDTEGDEIEVPGGLNEDE
jgi:hypothetical protein